MSRDPVSAIRWLCDGRLGPPRRLLPRWIFLRCLGLIYFSAFYSLLFQIRGLIGPDGLLPVSEYLTAVSRLGAMRFWFAPTLLWISTSSHMLMALCWIGLLASVLLFFNLWPRGTLFVCFLCFLSFVAAAQDFSGYQSDGMLLEAGFLSLFFAPAGFLPGWGANSPPSRASLFLLQFEWFKIYFESGVVKLASGDPEWRHFTAMDEYYQNGPLPTWVGWYMQHLPHGFHVFTTAATLGLELVLVWMLFLPRRWRIVCFCLVTPWQIVVILTANYTFLNYLVLALGFLLLDDDFLAPMLPRKWRIAFAGPQARAAVSPAEAAATSPGAGESAVLDAGAKSRAEAESVTHAAPRTPRFGSSMFHRTSISHPKALGLAMTCVLFAWLFYSSVVQMLAIMLPPLGLPSSPIAALEPFRIANRYGLFAVMTRGRYEIEFQGSNDGENWTPYPFRYKPQATDKAPGIYAPYQPRFDWNLWFASLGAWRDNMFVVSAEERLLNNAPDVLALFAGNPFPSAPPKQVRAVIWQYWFTSMAEKRATGQWWRRKYLGLYAPTLELRPDGRPVAVEWPAPQAPRE